MGRRRTARTPLRKPWSESAGSPKVPYGAPPFAGLHSLSTDSDPSAEPVGKPCLIDIVRSHSKVGRLSFVDVGGVRIPDDIVKIEEEYEASSSPSCCRRAAGDSTPDDRSAPPSCR